MNLKTAEMDLNKKIYYGFSTLILASGMSERMGQPKALLRWDDSMTFLEKIVMEYLDSGCERVICIVNREVMPHVRDLEDIPHVRLVLNEHPRWGRMYSVRLGLENTPGSDFCFIQNVDNPFINRKVIAKIMDSADSDAWCSPEFEGIGGHPVLLPKSIIRKLLEEKNIVATLQEVLWASPKKSVEMDNDIVLRNINTPIDYQNLFNRLV